MKENLKIPFFQGTVCCDKNLCIFTDLGTNINKSNSY